MYESYFGFSGKPFRLSPDPAFFFASPHHEKAISYLHYGLTLGEGFIVITGPIGTGKTIIVRSLLASLDESIVAAQITTTRLDPDQLITMVATQFGIDVDGLEKAELLKRIESLLTQIASQGKRALLIVDEAQNLPAESVEELRMLSNFQNGEKPLLQSFLLGQEELRGIIELPEMEQFRQRIIASCHLSPFDEAQTQAYIEHRLKQVGWVDNPVLDPLLFPPLTLHTGGIPRRINILADRLFLYAYLEEVETISVKHLNAVIEEIDSELAGSQPLSDSQARQVEVEPTRQKLPDTHLLDILDNVSNVLDDVIQRKVNTIRHLDKIITERKKTLAEKDHLLSEQKQALSKQEQALSDKEKKQASVMKTWFKK